MTSLRTMEGIDIDFVEKNFGTEVSKILLAESIQFIKSNKLQNENHKLFLTKKGKLFADGIAANLFFEEQQLVSL